MKSKSILCCILIASLIAVGTASHIVASAVETDGNPVSDERTETAVPRFTWDRNDAGGITIPFDTASGELSLIKDARLLATSLINDDLRLDNGIVTIGASLLRKLNDGVNTLNLMSRQGTIPISIEVTNEHPENSGLSTDNPEYNWNRNSKFGLTIGTNSASATVTIRKEGDDSHSLTINRTLSLDNGKIYLDAPFLQYLDNGKNRLLLTFPEGSVEVSVNVSEEQEPSSENAPLIAEATDFTWDKNSNLGLIIPTNSQASELVIKKDGGLFAASMTNPNVYITQGQICIEPECLKKLDVGTHKLSLILPEGSLSITVHVTGGETEKSDEATTLTADILNFTWDRSELSGLTVNTNALSDFVILAKNGIPLATNEDNGLSLSAGCVKLTNELLNLLNDGENRLELIFKDGTLPITIHVTDNKTDDGVIFADETEFTWNINSDEGVTLQTNSLSKNFSIKRDGIILTTGSQNQGAFIKDGKIILEASFLKKLQVGKNSLVLLFQDGKLDITVNVVDVPETSSVLDKEIVAETVDFTWDRSSLLGIGVYTNSLSRNVTVSKDGVAIASNQDLGAYVTLGRVGITAKTLRQLENGKNHLLLELDDGKLPITVTVTDSRHTSDISSLLTADQPEYTWYRNSGEAVTIRTNSTSQSAAVRRSDRLSKISDADKISIHDGAVTLTPLYLDTLKDGKNALTLFLDDGNLDITVNVITTESEESSFGYSSSPAIPSGTDHSGVFPDTGSTALSLSAIAAAVAACFVAIMTSIRRKRKTKAE